MHLEKGKRESGGPAACSYEVHASYKSDTAFIISKRSPHAQMQATPPTQSENPYVYKPKSYSTKRNAPHDHNLHDHPRAIPNKRFKKDPHHTPKNLSHFALDLPQLTQALANHTNAFTSSFFSTLPQSSHQAQINFPIKCQGPLEEKLNPMMHHQIAIVSNENEKIDVIIHDGVLNSNISHPKVNKDEHYLQGVVNPFDYNLKNHYLQTTTFQRDYKSGYAPIDMQLQNSDFPEETFIGSKTHYIRKKQLTLSLPRSCGVSYVKPSESHQQSPFDPLPPLIFQCSSNCSDSKETKQKYDEAIKSFIELSKNHWIPFIKADESQMRGLLLGQKCGEVGWVKGIQNLWPLYSEGVFILLLYTAKKCETESDVWGAFSSSIFKIGILAKKSTSGKKSFLKSLGIDEVKSTEDQKVTNGEEKNNCDNSTPEKQETTAMKSKNSNMEEQLAQELKDSRTVVTLSLRLEMYVDEKQWKQSSRENKDLLYCLITGLKENLQKVSVPIIEARLNCAKAEDKRQILEPVLNNILKYCPDSSNTIDEQGTLSLSKAETSHESIVDMITKNLQNNKTLSKLPCTSKLTYEDILNANKNQCMLERNLKMPIYYISTRDSFAFDLVQQISEHTRNGRTYKKIKYYFEPDNLPTNYGNEYQSRFPNFDVGITCYHDFFTNEEMKEFEQRTFATEKDALKNKFLQMTVQPSITASKIKRTKFFFGYRYMWTRCQLAEPGSYIGAGVRKDVTPPPQWTNKIVDAFVESNIAEKDFINSIAINVYHDGKEGLAQHFDDAVRFRQPIYTLRLFSDARLSFGSQFYGFCNGAFIIPLPRGCICVMEENSYAANGVKHCVRPCDMTGKSSAVILRQMHHQVVNEASRFDELIDFPSWVSCLSEHKDSVTFAQQKRREAQYCLATGKPIE